MKERHFSCEKSLNVLRDCTFESQRCQRVVLMMHGELLVGVGRVIKWVGAVVLALVGTVVRRDMTQVVMV